ncbi:MAG: polymerase primary sigma factor [Patescibacteria group bacterium]|nr:polymerase primary sigma factor [Patescibacteria group bacterium]
MRQLKITKQVTNRDVSSLDKYLQEIGRVELITPKEEIELAKRIREGDEQALEKLVKANLRFVVSVAKQYQNQGLPLSDLINEGNLGLIKAARKFDETRGFKFISYGVWWIRQSILQALAEQSRMVRLPLNQISTALKMQKASSVLEQKFEREPTAEEIANELVDSTSSEISFLRDASTRHVSLDAPMPNDESSFFVDTFACHHPESKTDHQLMKEAVRINIQRVFSTLTPRQVTVLTLHYGLNDGKEMTLEEIGIELEISRERVRQIKENSFKILRRGDRGKVLKSSTQHI